MHGTSPQLGEIDAIASAVQSMRQQADVLICPPATLVTRFGALIGGASLKAKDFNAIIRVVPGAIDRAEHPAVA